MQSNALDNSVNKIPNTFPLSTALFNFSSIIKTMLCVTTFPKGTQMRWKKKEFHVTRYLPENYSFKNL